MEQVKKAMISQPMNGLSNEEIIKTRNEIKNNLEEKGYEVIDTLFQEDAPEGVNPGIYFLGKSISAMAEADTIIFANGWESAKGCVIEYEVAKNYGKIIILLNKENKL